MEMLLSLFLQNRSISSVVSPIDSGKNREEEWVVRGLECIL